MQKAYVKNKKNYATFLYIPESESSVKSFRFPIWLPAVLTFTVAALVIFSVIGTSSFISLSVQHQLSKKHIDDLTQINNTQKIQIEDLQKNAANIQKQLEENIEMLEQLKKAVGLNTTSSNIDSSINNNIVSDSNYDTSAIKLSFESLSNELEAQKQEIQKSTSSIEKKLDFLHAKPSVLPVNASITCAYGYRKNPFTSRGVEFHKGVDFGAASGTKIVATADGTVAFSGWHSGYGYMVVINHGYGYTTCYAHNSKNLVKEGDKIKRGQTIAKVGSTGRSTGAHLHYEVKLNGVNQNPAKYF